MPKTLNSVTLSNDCIKFIETYCKRKDISEAAFSRKFGKNNRWVSDLRRGKNTNLPSKEIAVQMCLTLNVSPDDILLHEGKTPEETAKCLEDIETVRKLVEAERAKEKAHDQKIVGEDALDIELRKIWDSSDLDDRKAILEYAHFIKGRKTK